MCVKAIKESEAMGRLERRLYKETVLKALYEAS